jgi:histone-lysine N-methyltransferase SETMAR
MAQHRHPRRVVVHLSTDHEFIWFPRDEKVPERERHTVQSRKFMLTIVWNPRGFHLINVLPNGCTFSTDFDITDPLSPISEWRSTEARRDERKLIIHADNARPHNAHPSIQFLNQNRMKTAPHPPYLPDFAPSDFYLFGYAKGCLASLPFENADELLYAVQRILAGIQK